MTKTNVIKPCKEAMLVCDSIITEAATNKKSLIGIFEEITCGKLPFRHDSLSVYVKFTGALGDYEFKLELIDLHTNETIGRGSMRGPISIKDKLASFELVFNLRGLMFKHAGKFEFRIYANEDVFATKTFTVFHQPAGQSGQAEPPPQPL